MIILVINYLWVWWVVCRINDDPSYNKNIPNIKVMCTKKIFPDFSESSFFKKIIKWPSIVYSTSISTISIINRIFKCLISKRCLIKSICFINRCLISRRCFINRCSINRKTFITTSSCINAYSFIANVKYTTIKPVRCNEIKILYRKWFGSSSGSYFRKILWCKCDYSIQFYLLTIHSAVWTVTACI